MPRQARIDAPGDIICRGLERREIFRNDFDRDDFISRLGTVLSETSTRCFAWALIPNHFHLLLQTGATPIATVMRRLLTGYGVSFNRRHHRHGHLFQSRYKSILCQEETYLLELDVIDLWIGGKQPARVQARSLLCYWAVRELGLTATELSGKLNLSQPSVSRAVQRGERMARENAWQLMDLINA